jgi:flavin-dependent dehydrogenase
VTRRGRYASANIYGYWSGLDVDGYHWHWAPGATAGAIPTNGGQVLLFVGVSARRFAEELRGNVLRGYRRLLAHIAPDLTAKLKAARLHLPLRGFGGQPGFLRRPWGAGWALVGDAAYYKDPITAHGISDALRDAELLARAIVRGGDAALADYEHTRDALSTRLFEVTDRVASVAWGTAELKALHQAFSDEMKREVAALVSLHDDSASMRRTA